LGRRFLFESEFYSKANRKEVKQIKIILTILVISVCYGIIHDMITAHLCVEYFTIGHPTVIESDSPVLLALVWGVIATWWAGLLMGILIVAFNSIGTYPSLEYRQIIRLVLKLICIMFILAIVAGLIGYVLSEQNVIYLIPKLANRIDTSSHSRFLAAGWMHVTSYLTALIGTFIICFIIFRKRGSY
jgi:hypothetical protein